MPEHPYLFVKEGISSSVAVQRWPKGVRQLHISGKVVASTLVKDMRLQRVLGHLPALIHPRPKSVLIVGCGAGVTAGSFVVHPEVERIVICEIEPVVVEAAARYFSGENHHVLKDKRTEIIFDDARHFLATTKEKFDIITSDPIHPWVKGASALYSVEYYDLCKKHLKLGGIVTQWVPLYDTDMDTVKSEVGTFMKVFPYGTIWNTSVRVGRGYDVVVLGQIGQLKLNISEMIKRLNNQSKLQQSLQEVYLGTIPDLMWTYTGRGSELGKWLQGAQINHDMNLRLEYLAGFSLNVNKPTKIYLSMAKYRRYPEDIFGMHGTLPPIPGINR
jgi:spermidine synthase